MKRHMHDKLVYIESVIFELYGYYPKHVDGLNQILHCGMHICDSNNISKVTAGPETGMPT